mmetsp:Transcript_41424/g.104053  ORF Transcript_41424/g.104053 Transcript_41424/m.104053 type:complete len:354 (-) Transcript_41424:472-1533(-)
MDLDYLTDVKPSKHLALLDARPRGENRVFRHFHEDSDQVDEPLLRDHAFLVLVEGCKELREALLRRRFLGRRGCSLLFTLLGRLLLCLGLLLAVPEEGQPLGLADLAVLVGVDRREELLIREVFGALVVLEHLDNRLFQGVHFFMLLSPGVLAELGAEGGSLLQPCVEAVHLELQLFLLAGEPQLQLLLAALSQLDNFFLGVRSFLASVLDELIELIGQLRHLLGEHAFRLRLESKGVCLGLGDLTLGGLHLFCGVVDLLLILLPQPLQLLLPRDTCLSAFVVLRLLPHEADGDFQPLEIGLFHTLGIPHKALVEVLLEIRCGNLQTSFSLGKLLHLPTVQHTIPIFIVLVEH